MDPVMFSSEVQETNQHRGSHYSRTNLFVVTYAYISRSQ